MLPPKLRAFIGLPHKMRQIHIFTDSQIHRFTDSQIHRFTDSQIHPSIPGVFPDDVARAWGVDWTDTDSPI